MLFNCVYLIYICKVTNKESFHAFRIRNKRKIYSCNACINKARKECKPMLAKKLVRQNLILDKKTYQQQKSDLPYPEIYGEINETFLFW